MTRSCTFHGRKGFSLVELLVVTGVIALCCALLVPAFGKARDYSHRTRCLANLRQWGTALGLYMGQPGRDLFPTEGYGSAGVDILETSAWFNVLPPLIGQEALLERDQRGERMPRPRDRSIWTCDKVPSSAGEGYQSRTPFFSYAYNLWIDHRDRAQDHAQAGLASSLPPVLRFANLRHPSRFVVFGEHRTEGGAARYPNCHAYHLAFRHGGRQQRSNLLFADGHAESYARTTIYVDQSETNWKFINRGGIVWDPEGLFETP